MMKNKKGTIILSIILAVQFIIPLSVWGYETYKRKELEEKGSEIKVLVDYVNYSENQIEFQVTEIQDILDYYYSENYIVFKNSDDGFYTCEESKNIPETDLYISKKRFYSWYKQNWCFKYESEITKAQYEYDWYQLYNEENEKENIRKGLCEGPETQAYAVFKVYKNRFKVVDVYINGMPVDTVIEKYNNNEWDESRYEYNYDEYKQEEFDEYYDDIEEYYDEELEEYVTEPVIA